MSGRAWVAWASGITSASIPLYFLSTLADLHLYYPQLALKGRWHGAGGFFVASCFVRFYILYEDVGWRRENVSCLFSLANGAELS